MAGVTKQLEPDRFASRAIVKGRVSMFMPHGMCFLWQPGVLALHAISDSLIALAYFCIPVLILVYARNRPALWRVAAFFSAFIISCGSTHVSDVWTIWHPDYWLAGSLKAVTAVASIATVVSLLPVMPFARGLRRLLDLDRINARLEEASVLHRETRNILDTIAQIIMVRREDLSVEYLSPQWFAYTGAPDSYGLGSSWREYVHPDDIKTIEGETAHTADAPESSEQYEVRLRRRDGAYRWFLVRTSVLPNTSGTLRRWLTTSTDIDDLKRTERALARAAAELEHIAHHDPITNLPNRLRLTEELERALSRAQRSKLGVIVMYVDLDNFKAINDNFGHAAGDRVLAHAGGRIAAVLRNGDLACRIGGDEFVLVCMTSEGARHAARIAQRLLASLAKPMTLDGREVCVGASIGISLYPRDGGDVEGLMQKADTAMYGAKEAGRNCYRVFGDKPPSASRAALEFETELRDAIARNEFVVHYQPIVRLDDSRIVGAEALVRWQHPRRGLIAPAAFIPVAEANDTIAQLSRIVVDAACAELARLTSHSDEAFFVSVNISAKQFESPGFVALIADAIERHGVEPGRLEIEITENLMLSPSAVVVESLRAMRRLGVRLCLDDFGTGYCSLGYLRKTPLHTLKIDRSFVENVADSLTDQAIARTIVALAHSLDMWVIAEGVESATQLARLRELGCDCVQGFYISRPLPSAEFSGFLRQAAAANLARAAASRTVRLIDDAHARGHAERQRRGPIDTQTPDGADNPDAVTPERSDGPSAQA